MSSSASGLFSTPTIYGKVDYGPTFGQVYRPINPKRIVTVAGDVMIQPFDVMVIVAQTVPGNFNCILPDLNLWMLYPYGGFDLVIKNRNLGYDGTLVPFGSQKIDGLAALVVGAGEGVGGVVLSPLNDRSGWVTL